MTFSAVAVQTENINTRVLYNISKSNDQNVMRVKMLRSVTKFYHWHACECNEKCQFDLKRKFSPHYYKQGYLPFFKFLVVPKGTLPDLAQCLVLNFFSSFPTM